MSNFALPGFFHAVNTICIELLSSELNKCLYLNGNPDKYHKRTVAVSSIRRAMPEAAGFWYRLFYFVLFSELGLNPW